MPTRINVAVSADADSLAPAPKPTGHLTTGTVLAQFAAFGNGTFTAAGRPGSLCAASPDPGRSGAE